MLSVRLSSYGCTWEAGRAREKRLSGMGESRALACLASPVLSQLPKCIHNSIDTQLKHGPFLRTLPQPLYSVFIENTLKLIKCRIFLNRSERFHWLNARARFNRRTGVRLLRFRCTLAPCKKGAKICQLCSNKN